MSAEPVVLALKDAEILLYPRLFSPARADALLRQLLEEIDWRQEQARIHGRLRPLPRLTAWYADPGKAYAYSGIHMQPLPWTRCLQSLRRRLRALTPERFNSVLLNLYRDGNDCVGWHSDDETVLGPNPVIGSLSLGATRRFVMQHKGDKSLRQSIELGPGSFLLMAGATQHHWRHCLPRTRRVRGPRVNLTFRTIIG